jgi:hypothetical protein
MQFEGGFIMTIEQKAEYPGQFKTKANGTSGRWKGKKKTLESSIFFQINLFTRFYLFLQLFP